MYGPGAKRLTEHLKAGLAALEGAREAARVTIGADGALHLSTIETLPTDGIPKRTRDLIFKEIGTAQFADVIIERDAHTGFSEMFLSRKEGAQCGRTHLAVRRADRPGHGS
jgi:hypothetical protein